MKKQEDGQELGGAFLGAIATRESRGVSGSKPGEGKSSPVESSLAGLGSFGSRRPRTSDLDGCEERTRVG